MIPVILQVHVDRGQWVDVPVLPDTSCRDVIECCREPGDQPCRLIQSMGFKEEAIPLDSYMMRVLGKWGDVWPSVNFHLQYSNAVPVPGPRPFSPTEFTDTKNGRKLSKLPEGSGELSLADLRQMAARQQHQIEAHQQLLVAKEQRLKFLKQQESRNQHHQHQGLSVDVDRLRHLKERVELQEHKLRRLRALRGQVEQHRSNNTNLSAELDSIRALFNEKEKELSMAVAKVEELTRQLEDVRRGDVNSNRQGSTPSPAALEFQKLRRELLYRSKLNEQQNARIAHQRETLAKRQSEISQMDQRIAELQQRLQRKRQLNTQLSSQLHAASRAHPKANIAAVEPLKRATQDVEIVQDDLKVSSDPIVDFIPNKKDPKYQTLPYNTKFSGVIKNENGNRVPVIANGDVEKHVHQNGGPPPYHEPPNRFQTPHKPSPPHGLGNLSPRPFGTTYSTSLLTADKTNRGHPDSSLKNPVSSSTAVTSPNVSSGVSTGHLKMSTSTAGVHRPKPPVSYLSHQSVLPPTIMTSQSGISRSVPQTPARQHIVPNLGSLHVRTTQVDTSKPMVPPKPSTPSKPIPPPRQIHGIGLLPKNLQKPDTVDQALSVLKGNCGSSENRLALKIPPPGHHQRTILNQHSPPKPDLHSSISREASSESDSGSSHVPSESKSSDSTHTSEASAIHISLNRRIGMPPAFFFPENQTPPSDLNISDSSEHLISLKRRPIVQTEVQLLGVKSNLDSPPSSCEGSPASISPNSSKETSSPVEKCISSSSDQSPECVLQKNLLSSVDTTDRAAPPEQDHSERPSVGVALRRAKKGNLKTKGGVKNSRRVSFDPLALLLDAALEGELELVKKTAKEVTNPSAANDEGITALHNAICAGHFEIVKFLVEFGCDVNAQDSDGWTPLHCAASCNNLGMVKYLAERGACIFATTMSDQETAAEKCEEEEEGFDGCSEYLYSMQEKLGILNSGTVYSLYSYEGQNSDELSFKDGDQLVILRKGDDLEREWWWSKHNDREGYVPRNLLGLYPRITQKLD